MIICFRCARVRGPRQTITFMALARFAFEIFRLTRASRTHNTFGRAVFLIIDYVPYQISWYIFQRLVLEFLLPSIIGPIWSARAWRMGQFSLCLASIDDLTDTIYYIA